jgi:hypothetical protein
VAQHHELGPVALGLLKRQVPDDAGVVARVTPGEAADAGDAALLPVTVETVA